MNTFLRYPNIVISRAFCYNGAEDGDIMSVYVTSDLHGLRLEDFMILLGKADFSDKDNLYILGDVIDRQNDGGVELLLWIMEQNNVNMLLGNHEDMLLECEFALGPMTEEMADNITPDRISVLSDYIYNGGEVTVNALNSIGFEKTAKIIEYLKQLPLYKRLRISDKKYLLVHSGLGDFDVNKKLTEYSKTDLLWTRPDFDDEYYDDITVILGHTPTIYYGSDHKGRILHRATWIDVDVGAAYGNSPALLRLDDMKEFYL